MSARQDPFVVTRYDVAIEPAPEEKPILTIGAVTIGGHPVALLFGLEDRAKVVRWLAPDLHDEVDALRARVAELEATAALVAEFCADRASYITSIRNCHPDNGHDYDRWQGHAAARRQLSLLLGLPVAWPAEDKPTPVPQQRQAEDPHSSDLHHDYALGRDLPAIPHQQDRRAL
ncbi:MAG TPA: hypothetical protein VF049_22225 [Nocardioidaceae bacterium]